MNLVQINERLKDLPMQVIQQYANGMNPEVPPYLALGELQRRELSQKQMANQGGAQGPQPSVKEQVEQKAGLMALQQMQQQQMAQQQAMPRGPMPAPEGIAQPEQQPEATMMASGGLASLPVKFDFASGGIVAFQDGGPGNKYETRADKLYRENREAAERKKREFDAFNAQISDDPAQVKMREAQQEFESLSPAEKSSERGRRLKDFIKGIFTAPPAAVAQAPMAAPAKPAAPVSRPTERMTPQQMESSMVLAGLPGAAMEKGIAPRALAPRPQAPQIAPPAAPAAPAQPDPNSMDAMLRAQLAKPSTPRTMEEVLAEQRAAREGAGMGEPAGLAQLDRIRKLQEQYEGSKPSGLDDLIRVFGQAGQYKGLSGLAPAYTANQQQKRSQDLAMAERINQLMGGVETTQRGEMKDIATGALTGLGTDRATAASRDKDVLSALGTGRGQDITADTADKQRRTQERGQDLTYKAQMAQVAVSREAKAQGADDKQIAAAEAAYARDPEAAIIKERLKNPIYATNPARAEVDLKRLREIQASKYQQFGITLQAAPSAESPSGTPRMKFDANGNPIK
jgi:hypothetical protein